MIKNVYKIQTEYILLKFEESNLKSKYNSLQKSKDKGLWSV